MTQGVEPAELKKLCAQIKSTPPEHQTVITAHLTSLCPQQGSCCKCFIAHDTCQNLKIGFLPAFKLNLFRKFQSTDLQLLSRAHTLWKYFSTSDRANILKYW